MRIVKSFARDGNALGDCMDQLVEVLAQLLDEQAGPAVTTDLRSDGTGVIHVLGEPNKMMSEPKPCR